MEILFNIAFFLVSIGFLAKSKCRVLLTKCGRNIAKQTGSIRVRPATMDECRFAKLLATKVP